MAAPTDQLPAEARRWAWVEIDHDAVRHNVASLRALVAPSDLHAVVKANGYGHGAVEVTRAALDGGATGLCVALVQEGVELRRAGIDAPILVLSEQPVEQLALMLEHALTPTAYSVAFIDALAATALANEAVDVGVHLKIDTGMQRVGAPPDAFERVLARVRAHAPTLRLEGVFTHLAVADEPMAPFTAEQLDRFDAAVLEAGLTPVSAATDADERNEPGVAIHVANSAGALAHPDARRSFVRAGIAIYGISPGQGVDDLVAGLRPVLSLHTRVSYVKRVAAGTGVSYGLRHTFDRDTIVATLPIGYADGVPRRLSSTGGEVLIGGRRCPIVGVVTMDQMVVDCGPGSIDDHHVRVGDEVVLIGEQEGPNGAQRISVEDWAERLETIGYEIVCGISSRVPRVPRRIIDG